MKAADSIQAALEHHLEGVAIAERVARERERAHAKRLVDSSWCPDCLAMCGDGVCEVHNENAGDL